jgi:integrase
MARRSGQAGVVVLKGCSYRGRYWADVPGQQSRVRKSVYIGPRKEMTKRDAQRKLRKMLEEMGINTEAHLNRAINPSETFQQKATRWENTELIMCKPSSANIPYVVRKHLIPPFGALPLDVITEDKVKEWLAGVLKDGKLAPKSIHNVWKILRLILGHKHTNGWKLKLPSIPRKEQRYFKPEEVKKIIDKAEGHYKTVFALQFATGMRFGELAGLHVEDIDFENSIIHIRRSTFKLIDTTPKTDAGYRAVNVDSDTMAMLKLHLGNRQAGRVFQTRNGTPLVHANINRHVLKPICRELGIPIGTTHAFRHGRVSVLQKARVQGDLIREWIGHTSLRMTSKYTHLDDEYKAKVISELSKT